MHEMGLTDAVLKMVDGILAENNCRGASKITLEIGDLSGVVPRFVRDCWTAVADGTRYEKTELVLESAPGTAKCLDCGLEFPADLDHLVCPDCLSRKLQPLTGMDMTIKEIEAY
jgi:hydrogenase nickel incorporation protein HypA/HybF